MEAKCETGEVFRSAGLGWKRYAEGCALWQRCSNPKTLKSHKRLQYAVALHMSLWQRSAGSHLGKLSLLQAPLKQQLSL